MFLNFLYSLEFVKHFQVFTFLLEIFEGKYHWPDDLEKSYVTFRYSNPELMKRKGRNEQFTGTNGWNWYAESELRNFWSVSRKDDGTWSIVGLENGRTVEDELRDREISPMYIVECHMVRDDESMYLIHAFEMNVYVM